MSQTLSLYRLQQADRVIDRSRARLQEIQNILDNNEEMNKLKEQADLREKEAHAARMALREAEQAAHAQKIKIEQVESSMYGGTIHNPKELQDLQNDLASLKKYLTVLEDKQLEALLSQDTFEQETRTAQQAVVSLQAQLTEKNAVLLGERTSLEKEIEKAQTERDAIVGSIDAATLAKYTQLRQQRKGVAVARIIDNSCEICGSVLTHGHQQAVHTDNQIEYCPSCGRILFAG